MASVLQDLSTTPVDGVVLCPSMFGDRCLVGVASNAGILVLLEPSSEASLGLPDVDLSTCAWYLVHDVRLLLNGERVFDLSKHGPESRARSKHHSDVVVPARLSDPLTNACYIRQHHQRKLALSLCFFGVGFSRLAFLRCCSDEGSRVAIPLQGTREVGLLHF